MPQVATNYNIILHNDVDNVQIVETNTNIKTFHCTYKQSTYAKLIDSTFLPKINSIIYSGNEAPNIYLNLINTPYSFDIFYKIFSDVTIVPTYMFDCCHVLTSVNNIPRNITKIANKAFNGCENLKRVALHKNITSIGSYAFDGCNLLQKIDLSNITDLYDYSLCGLGITEVKLNNEIPDIYPGLFKDCVYLKEFKNENNPYKIGKFAFSGCKSLQNVIISEYLGEAESKIKPDEFCLEYEEQEIETNTITETTNKYYFAFNGEYEPATNPSNDDYSFCLQINEDIFNAIQRNPNFDNEYTLHVRTIEETHDYDIGIAHTIIITRNITRIIQRKTNVNISIYYKNPYNELGNNKYYKVEFGDANWNYENNIHTQWSNSEANFTNVGYNTKANTVVRFISSQLSNYISQYAFYIHDSIYENFATNIDDSYNIYDDPLWVLPFCVTKLFGFRQQFDPSAQSNIIYTDQIVLVYNCYPVYDSSEDNILYFINDVNEINLYRNEEEHKLISRGDLGNNTFIDPTFDNDNGKYPIYKNGFKEFGHEYITNEGEFDVLYYATAADINKFASRFEQTNIYSFDENNPLYFWYLQDEGIDYGIKRANKSIVYGGATSASQKLPDFVFSNCISLTNVSFMDQIKEIGNSSMLACASYKNLSNKFTKIGNNGLKECIALTSLDLSECSTIGNNALQHCIGLKNIDLSSLITCGEYAFDGCSNLTRVNNMPLTEISKNLFSNCLKLQQINLTDNHKITTIDDYGFYSCLSLFVLDLSEVTKFGKYALYNCKTLDDNTFSTINSDNNIEFGEGTFYGCDGLTEITLPSSVVSLPNYLFKKCKNLKKLTFRGTYDYNNKFNLTALHECPSISQIIMPNNENDRYITINNNCVIDTRQNKLVYVCKNLNIFEFDSNMCKVRQDEFANDLEFTIDENAFNGCNISVILMKCPAPQITTKTFKNIGYKNWHILINKDDPKYSDYKNKVGKHHIYTYNNMNDITETL